MLAFSPLFSSGFGWNLDEPAPLLLEKCNFLYSDEVCSQLNNDYNNNNTSNNVEVDVGNLYHRRDVDVIDPPLVSGSPTQFSAAAAEARSGNHVVGSEQSSQQLFSNSDEMPSAVEKKLNHNASERDRRRKINGLYSSLRSLLPPSHHSKKLSIPATVSRVLKYIPELQKEVEGLIHKKEELLHRRNSTTLQTLTGNSSGLLGNGTASPSTQQGSTSLCSVQATQISSAEVMIQMSTVKLMGQTVIPFSEVLRVIEEGEDGLSVVHVSYFESFGGRFFYNVHLQVEGGRPVKCEVMSEKLLSCCQRCETILCRRMS